MNGYFAEDEESRKKEGNQDDLCRMLNVWWENFWKTLEKFSGVERMWKEI